MTIKTPTPKSPARRASRTASNGNRQHFPEKWLWTADEFQCAYDLGAFGFDVRLELIEGEIIRKMGQSAAHAWAICAMQGALRGLFPSGHDVRCQLPLVLGTRSKPEPDLAVVAVSSLLP